MISWFLKSQSRSIVLIQRVWIELHFLFELLDVPREYREHCCRSPFEREVMLTLSFLSRSDRVGTCLSPVSTVVKPAYPVIAHHPKPIQEGESQRSQLNQKSMSCSVCGRTSVCILCIVHFSELLGLITCRQLRCSHWAESRNVLWIVAVIISA